MVGLAGLSYGGSTGLELELAGKRFVPAEVSRSRPLLDRLSRRRTAAAGLPRRLGGTRNRSASRSITGNWRRIESRRY
jgi:hypothetical protein